MHLRVASQVLEAATLVPLEPRTRSGYNAWPDERDETEGQHKAQQGQPKSHAKRGLTVRQSVPNYGGKTRLGGASSYQAMQIPGLAERGRQRIYEWDADTKAADMTTRIIEVPARMHAMMA